MSKAKCPKCGNDDFEAIPQGVDHLNLEIFFVACKSCSTAIGVVEGTTVDNVKDIKKALRLRD